MHSDVFYAHLPLQAAIAVVAIIGILALQLLVLGPASKRILKYLESLDPKLVQKREKERLER